MARWPLWGIGGLAFIQAVSFMALAVGEVLPLPVHDLMGMLLSYDALGLSMAWLLPLHNSHAILLPRLVLALDVWLFDGATIGLASFALLARGAVFFMLAWAVWRVRDIAPSLRGMAIAALALLLFQGFLLETIAIPNGYNYEMMAVFSVASLICASHGRSFILASLFALAASLCLANGILLFLVLASVAWMQAEEWKQRFAWMLPIALSGAAAAGFYLAGSSAGDGLHDFNAWTVAHFMLRMAGAPLTIWLPVLGHGIGLLLLLASLAGIVWAIRNRFRLDSLGRLAFCLLLFGFGSLFMVAVGRVGAGFGAEIATAGRYGLLTAFLYAGLVLLLLRMPWITRPAILRGFQGGLLAIALCLVCLQFGFGRSYVRLRDLVAHNAVALRAGARDVALLAHMQPDAVVAWRFFDLLQQRQLYGFGKPEDAKRAAEYKQTAE
ncbi:hypothetical protein [Ferrovibrio sp.]|uniref:hypothetical protein n=1 Tax=Ferrovibrio sp. TaxID=1917215 RepID=UPI0025B9E2C0|nr:hypothetical protein [Ferrovibrio sp.]MBX3454577.1 hypothetical protein [Ferrovibrio sp.]